MGIFDGFCSLRSQKFLAEPGIFGDFWWGFLPGDFWALGVFGVFVEKVVLSVKSVLKRRCCNFDVGTLIFLMYS